jgi:hypothetical protein
MAEIMDGTGGVFFAKQLEQIKSKAYNVLYPEFTYDKAFDVSSEVDPGAQEIVYQTFDQRGEAKLINGNAQDIPRVDVDGKETRIPVRTIADSFGYTMDEIEAARFAGVPLDQKRAAAARRIIEEKMNYLAWFGDAAAGLIGFFTTSLIDSSAAADIGGGVTVWSSKSAAQILADVNTAFSAVFENTKGVERANRLGLPLAQWNLVMTTNMGTGTDTTIAQYIVQNSPFLTSLDQIMAIPELQNAVTSGTEDAMIVWTKNPDKVQIEIPMDVTFMEPEKNGLEYVTIARSRYAGMNMYYPKSAYILTDI